MKGSELVARIEKFEQNLNSSILSLSLYYHLSLIDNIFHSISQITFHRFYMICDFDLLVLTAVCFPSNKLIWNMRKKISKVFFFLEILGLKWIWCLINWNWKFSRFWNCRFFWFQTVFHYSLLSFQENWSKIGGCGFSLFVFLGIFKELFISQTFRIRKINI